PPWHSNQLKRLVKTPKLHIGDTGLACALMGVNPGSLWMDRPLFGRLLESYVYQELRRLASFRDESTAFYHFRDKDQVEVDLVIESEGLVAGVEVKAASTVTTADFKGLRKLKDAAGSRFVCGVVLYDGSAVAGFGEGLYAVPVSRLWSDE
ncbi:MAG TPA: DUF4143 domain-containing protein, partial [Myxococcota bacterium]|nr:DUF4143 domain-containing protein [Myxococcota bacterium]